MNVNEHGTLEYNYITMFCDEWALLLFHAWCLYFSELQPTILLPSEKNKKGTSPLSSNSEIVLSASARTLIWKSFWKVFWSNLLILFMGRCKSWELVNFDATFTWKMVLQCIHVLKEAICHCSEVQQTNLNGTRSIFTECKGYANGLWMMASWVITLYHGNFFLRFGLDK